MAKGRGNFSGRPNPKNQKHGSGGASYRKAPKSAPAAESGASNPYPRVRIEGVLECVADLHVGRGDTESLSGRDVDERQVKLAGSDHQDSQYHQVSFSPDLGPFLPASTVRGALRRITADETLRTCWFGTEKQVGRLRLFDAFLDKGSPGHAGAADAGRLPPQWWPARRTAIHQGIEMDPASGTARHGRLYSHEIVPAGSRFRVEMEIDRIGDEDIRKLLMQLKGWDGSARSALGARRSKGWGLVRWSSPEVKVLTSGALAKWLASSEHKPLSEVFAKWDVVPPTGTVSRPDGGIQAVKLTIHANAPLLVSDPGQRLAKQHEPDHEYARQITASGEIRSILPGSTLVGAARGRARKIVATIAHQHYGAEPDVAVEIADGLVQRIFGTKGWRSALWISNAEPDTQAKPLDQYFIAVDRFTGGAADGAFYRANARIDRQWTAELTLEHGRLNKRGDGDWWKGLLLFVARDAIEGELAIGWGKAKGYGAISVTLAAQDARWEACLNGSPGAPCDGWIKALHEKIEQAAASRSESSPEGSGAAEVQP